MENEKKLGQLKNFNDLDIAEKLRSVLGAVMEPVTKEMAYGFAGVDYTQLDNESRNKVDNVFNDENVEQSGNSEFKYRLNDDARNILATEVDMISVHGAISDVLLAWWNEKKP